ncbi:MAG: hypothetical protein U7126_03005 [Microcoleus sp.]
MGWLVIGQNSAGKQQINLASETPKFASIPTAQLIERLIYQAELVEIRVIITEESYTSKCSFLDNQLPGKQAQYLGKRVERELCHSQLGLSINTDEKGCALSVRKVFPDAVEAQGIRAIVVWPLRIAPDELKAVPWAGSPT